MSKKYAVNSNPAAPTIKPQVFKTCGFFCFRPSQAMLEGETKNKKKQDC